MSSPPLTSSDIDLDIETLLEGPHAAVVRALGTLGPQAPRPAAEDPPRETPSVALANILFVGPATAGLREQCEVRRPGRTAFAESFIEAILLTGLGTECHAVVAGISQETEHLERAIVSLRGVKGQTRIILLADPADEPLARRALRWGADDYAILPLDLDSVLQLAEPSASAASPAPDAAPIATPASAGPIVRMSLSAETAALLDLLNLRPAGETALLTRLQEAHAWPGQLVLLASDTPPANLPAAAIPVRFGTTTFGTLAIRDVPASPALLDQLQQAAAWTAAWLTLASRDEELRTLAITDELSSAYNRRYFNTFVEQLLERARCEHFRVSLLLFDIDNFKHYNDRHGHAAGDEIIRQLIALLRRCTRPNDLVARLGGDEFAVVFWDHEAPRQPNSQHPRDAIAASERFRKAIAAHDWSGGCRIEGAVSVSGGIATFPWDAGTLGALLSRADEALLRAKNAGKNVIHLNERPIDDAPVRPPAYEGLTRP